MAMDMLELVIIGVIIVVFVVLGPSKIPQLARALGSAKTEFNAGQQANPMPSGSPSPATIRGEDELMVAAAKLGISTEGKSREQISAEIVRKTAGT